MVIVEGEMEPIGLNVFSVGNDNELNQLFRKAFNLPNPVGIIKRLNEIKYKKLGSI